MDRSSRTEVYGDVVDVTPFSALGVVEQNLFMDRLQTQVATKGSENGSTRAPRKADNV